jgi:HAE1 family hydrophobic/amphiphilic exporter-1
VNLSAIFIRRPIATSLLMLAIALFGVVAYRALPVSDLPNVDYPTLVGNAGLSGADPGTMASAVATPLERQFTTIAGVDEMTSSSSMGSSSVTLQFDLSRDIDSAAVDVETAIAEVMPLLPPGMPSTPSFRKYNPADSPILMLALTSPTLPLSKLQDYAETLIALRVSMVSGVAQVTVFGAQKYAVRVQADPDKLRAAQVGLDELANALSNWNVNLPTGTITGPKRSLTLQATGQLMIADAYRPVIVSYRKGAPVRLGELGSIIDGVEDDKTGSWYSDRSINQRAIVLAVQRQPGTNTIEVANGVKALIPRFRSELPPAVHMDVLYDRSDTIRESYADVRFTMFLTLALVVMVIFVFLRNVWATIIPSLALPFSIVGTFAVMSLLDFSLDNLSMMALILCVGFVVDDAIVMLENIVRHMERGERPMQAALNGSREIGFTIVSMTLSLAAVFIPVLFMGGILGRLFREFSVTICVAILISGVVSVTLTPMLCSRFLRRSGEHRRSALYRATERFFTGMLGVYDRTLQIVLRHRPATIATFFIVLVATVALFIIAPKGFIPDQDTDQIAIVTEAAQGTSYQKLADYQNQVADIVRRNPNVQAVVSTVGGTAASTLGGPNLGQLVVHLKPRHERRQMVDEIISDLRPEVAKVPNILVYLQNPPTVRIGGQVSKSLYQFSMQSPDRAELYKAATDVRRALESVPGIQDLTSDLEVTSPQVDVQIDRDKAASLQVNASQIENAFYDAYGPRWVSTIYGSVNEYKVLLELKPQYQADPRAMSLLYFKSAAGALIPLDTLAKVTEQIGPQTVNHYGQLPAVTVSFNLAPGASLGTVLGQVRTIAERTLPQTVNGQFQGAAKAFEGSILNLAALLIVAVLVVYIVLGILYESYIHPLTILSGLPSAGFGALVTLAVFRMDLNIYAFVGIIMLIGIVEKNAIMQVDFALEAERSGMTPLDAIYKGCLIRFRPIMMTTMAALLGAVPMATGV